MTREELKQECVRRMHKLGIMPKVIGDFKKSFHKLYKSEFNGILYWLDEEEQRIVTLHVLWGYKHREIADIIGSPTGTVTSKYKRAIKN